MKLEEGEIICDKCKGTDKINSICQKCNGKGKLDWVSNAMGTACGNLYFTPVDSITLCANAEQVLKITKDGFYINDKRIVGDNKIYDAFVDFLRQTGFYI